MNSVIEAYRKIAPSYEKILGSIYMFAPRQVDDFFGGLPRASEILDAGCGPGFESAVGARHGHRMTGLDACDEMLERFRVNVPSGKALAGEITRIPAPSGTFDAVFSSCVLLHLGPEDAVAAIREFHRMLRIRGKLLLVTNVSRDEDIWASRPALAAVGVDKLYFHNWDKDRLLAAVSSAGFEVDGSDVVRIKPETPEVIFIQGRKPGN